MEPRRIPQRWRHDRVSNLCLMVPVLGELAAEIEPAIGPFVTSPRHGKQRRPVVGEGLREVGERRGDEFVQVGQHPRTDAPCGFDPLAVQAVDKGHEIPLGHRRPRRRRGRVPVPMQRHAAHADIDKVRDHIAYAPCSSDGRPVPGLGGQAAKKHRQFRCDGTEKTARVGRRHLRKRHRDSVANHAQEVHTLSDPLRDSTQAATIRQSRRNSAGGAEMRMVHGLAMLAVFAGADRRGGCSNADHDGQHRGRRRRCQRRRAARRRRRGAQRRHEPHADAADRSRRPLRGAAAAARPLHGHVHAVRLRDARAGERRGQRRPVAAAVADDEAVERRRNGQRHRAGRRRSTQPDRRGQHARRNDDRHHADSRPQVRGPAHADAGRQRSSRDRTATRSPSPDSAASSTTSASTAATTTTGSSASRSAASARRSTSRSTPSRSSRSSRPARTPSSAAPPAAWSTSSRSPGTNQTHGQPLLLPAPRGPDRRTRPTASRSPTSTANSSAATVGGPIVKDKVFYFGAIEGIGEHLLRPNLSEPIGTPCPVANPTLAANEALINASADCQRVALLNFFKTTRGQDEGQPVPHTRQQRGAARQDRLGREPQQQPVGVLQLQLLEEREPDVRRRRPTARRPTAPRGRRRSTCSTRTCSRTAHARRS